MSCCPTTGARGSHLRWPLPGCRAAEVKDVISTRKTRIVRIIVRNKEEEGNLKNNRNKTDKTSKKKVAAGWLSGKVSTVTRAVFSPCTYLGRHARQVGGSLETLMNHMHLAENNSSACTPQQPNGSTYAKTVFALRPG